MAKKTSIRRKVLSNTLRPDRLRQDVAARLKRCPSPPGHLSALAQGEWQRLAPVAHDLGTLTAADLRAFELLCETLATESQAREAIDREGLTIPTPNAGSKTNPAVKTMEAARNQAARLLADFGLTPKGRLNLEPAPELKGNPFKEL